MYLITQAQTEDQVKGFSALFWSICTVAGADTIYGPTWHHHAETGQWALHLVGDWYVHPTADLEPFLAALPIPDSERDTLRGELDAARGTHVSAISLVPPSMQAALVDALPVPDDDSQWDEGVWALNINTADAETLAERLPGVGASLAQAIVDGRPWADPADLAQIGGISAAMVEGWESHPGLLLEDSA